MTYKVYIQTFGCQMNEHDSEYMAGLLYREGFFLTNDIKEADIVLINSCTIRNKAEEKAFSLAGRLYVMKRTKPDLKIGFCGCVAQREGERIFSRAPYIDLVYGTLNIPNLPLLIKRLLKGERQICEILDIPVTGDDNPCIHQHASNVKAWITIMEGCNNFCTYCVVPYIRGRERSRKIEDILNEAVFLANAGYKEITLLGQNVNSYGKDLNHPVSFSDLLLRLNTVEGIDRIRFVTSHPKDITLELINTMAQCQRVCEHIHLPLQSGSDRILKRMGRGYTFSEYLEKIRALRDTIPSISITSDIICGFPGETEAEFEETIKAIEDVEFDGLFSFKYSERPQTAASDMIDQVPEEVRLKRLQILQKLQNSICSKMNAEMKGLIVPVLIEGRGRKDGNKLIGRTRSNKIVIMKGPDNLLGQLIRCKIIKTNQFNLEGKILLT